MTDEPAPASAPATPAPPPLPEDVQKFSASQANTWLTDLKQRTEWVGKFLSNDVTARKLFDALVYKRAEGEEADQIVAGADVPLPEGGANDHGLSKRDVHTGVAALLNDGLSAGSVSELLRNQPVVSAEDYRVLSRAFQSECLSNPQWKAALLAGDPVAKRQLLAMGVIRITSKPLPESSRFDVVK